MFGIKITFHLSKIFKELPRPLHDLCSCMLCARTLRTISGGAICTSCAQRMGYFRSPGEWPLSSRIWCYEGIVRELIVATKARGGIAEFGVCKNFFVNASASREAADWCDVVLAPPPSFWSRVRLRPHLGSELAFAFGNRYSKPVVRAISPVFWRITKQAMKKRNDRVADRTTNFAFNACLSQYQRILLVDDVQTSGKTLQTLMHSVRLSATDAAIRSLVMAGSGPKEPLRSRS